MSNPKNFNDFFIKEISRLLNLSNNKFSCIEDQFYYIDKFPKYEEDDENVFKCEGCGCLLQVDCLTECDDCEKNFCDFKHTEYSICDQKHNCAERILRTVTSRWTFSKIQSCISCIQANTNNRYYLAPIGL